jgi:hypothetical protein
LAGAGLAAAVLVLPAADLAAADSPAAQATKVAALSPATIGRTLQVRKGDTLMKLLIDAGIARPEAHEAIAALTQVYSPRELRPGQSIELVLSAPGESAGPRLAPGRRPLLGHRHRPALEPGAHRRGRGHRVQPVPGRQARRSPGERLG